MLSLNQDCILTDSEPVFLKYKNVNIFPLVLVWNCELNVGGGKLTWTYSPFAVQWLQGDLKLQKPRAVITTTLIKCQLLLDTL